MGGSNYGVRIRNHQAGSIMERMQGVRDVYDYTDAMLTNSLFLDFLLGNGLKVSKSGFTKQIVGVAFDYGTRSYEDEKAHIDRLINERGETEKLASLREKCDGNKEKYVHYSPAELREKFYCDGFDLEFANSRSIHYKMLYRSVGKAKKGVCMFIDQRLYKKAHEFLWMGLKLPKKNAPIVEMGAYSSLVASTIVDRIQINPNDVLILNDVDSFFRTDVVSIETDNDRHCIAKHLKGYEVGNIMFDGQALIDSSIFPDWADGYILLRQHFTKCAAFCTNIQQFFMDYFGAGYDAAVVVDMFGNSHKAKDIKMITTNNAVKFLKFGVTYEYWKKWVLKNGGMWGIVKTSHESKLGDAQRMSYQMVNTLSEDSMESVMRPSIEYVEKLKTDTHIFIDYLRHNTTFVNDYDVLIALYEQDHSFEYSTYWKNRRSAIIDSYMADLKNGRLRQEADNCTIVGSPYAMLLHSVGESVEKDLTLVPEDGVVQCYSERFGNGEFLAGFRSPMNSRNNVVYLHNIHSPVIGKYFNLGKLCIAVNMRNTDFQCRNNGSDQDSDSLYVTDQKDIVEHSRKCYMEYPTIVNNIPKDSNVYANDFCDFARIDNILAASQLAIGESSNLAQIALSYTYNFTDCRYQDYVCILATIAQCAIDISKRTFDIDIPSEVDRIRGLMDIGSNLLPEFWVATSVRGIKKQFKDNKARSRQMQKVKGKINHSLHCPMNAAFNISVPRIESNTHTLHMEKFFVRYGCSSDIRINKRIEALISKYSLDLYSGRVRGHLEDADGYLLYREDFEWMVNEIRSCVIPSKYASLFSWLIDRAFIITSPLSHNRHKLSTALNKNRPLLLKALYCANPQALLACFSKNVPKTAS